MAKKRPTPDPIANPTTTETTPSGNSQRPFRSSKNFKATTKIRRTNSDQEGSRINRSDAAHSSFKGHPQADEKEAFVVNEVLRHIPAQPFGYPTSWAFELTASVCALLATAIFTGYLVLITCVSGGLIFHAIFNTQMLSDASGPVLLLRLAFYLGLLITGLIFLALLLKPFFYRAYQPRQRCVKQQDETILYEVINRIASFTGALPINEIRVSQMATTRLAREKTGLVLILSLPQIRTSSIRQFSATITTLYGIQSQLNKSKRLRYTAWLLGWWKTTSTRFDRFDLQIFRQLKPATRSQIPYSTQTHSKPHAVIYWFLLQSVRCIYQVFYSLTRLTYNPASRHITRSAATATARLIGSKEFEAMFRNQFKQSRCYEPALNQMLSSTGTLNKVSDYARYFAFRHNKTEWSDSKLEQQIEAYLNKKTDNPLSANQQITHAKQNQEPGLLTCDAPASRLFCCLDNYSQLSTIDMLGEVRSWDWHYVAEWDTGP